MTNVLKNSVEKKTRSINPAVATVAGIAGVGVAIATYYALKDSSTRMKIKEVLTLVKNKALDYMEANSVTPKAKPVVHKLKSGTKGK